jgi:hypothetical protein
MFIATGAENVRYPLASARLLRDLAPDWLASGHGPVITAPGPAMTRAIEAPARKID